MRKPVYAICEQQRHRSACASAQSDQRFCCSWLIMFGTFKLKQKSCKTFTWLVTLKKKHLHNYCSRHLSLVPYLQFRQNNFIGFLLLIPALLAYQKPEKTKVKVENTDKMPYMKHDPKWSKMLYLQPKRLIYPFVSSQMHFV